MAPQRLLHMLLLCSLASLVIPAGASGGITERVSVNSSGEQAWWGIDESFYSHPTMSADGRFVVFDSNSANLPPEGGHSATNVYVRDRLEGLTFCVSVTPSGQVESSESYGGSISGDGRYVAFHSWVDDGVQPDSADGWQVFVRDLAEGTIENADVATTGELADGRSISCTISADGRYVLFESSAHNLTPEDTGGIFLRDRVLNTTERVSWHERGHALSWADGLSMSNDGRFVVFSSFDPFVDSDTNRCRDVFLRDRLLGTTERVSIGTNGEQGNEAAGGASISDDGRYVVFSSEASNLVSGDTNGYSDVFLRDRELGTTTRISLSASGHQLDADSDSPTISDDGCYVAFRSGGAEVVPGHIPVGTDIFVWNRLNGIAELVSASTAGAPADGNSYCPSISADGRFVAFDSHAANLVPGDTNDCDDAFIRDRLASPGEPLVDFSGAPTSGPAPLRVNFTDLSLGGPTSWEWEFGDGGASTQQNPSHTYSKAGTYTVSLTAAYAEGPDTETKLGYVSACFPDVTQYHWACQEILACADGAIAAGYDDGCYHGDAPVTRDQMAVYIARALAGGEAGVPEASPPATFEDVPQDHWAWQYVEYAVTEEVVQGCDATTYAPEVEVDRGQMAVFVARAKGWVGIADDMTSAPELFPDVPAGFWSGTAIQACVDNEVVQGYLDGHYYPEVVVTRDQMAVYVARAFGLI